MSKLYMMAGAVAGGADASTEEVSAYVILADGPKSRVFKLAGLRSAPRIEELSAATTLDLKRFQEQVSHDLGGLGGLGAARPADKAWACDVVRVHLRLDLGL